MLSAVISSALSYPAMPRALQPVHQWCVHAGPLVLGAAPLKLPTPTADRDQTVSRRFKPSSRTSLNGEQPYPCDRLQPQDDMSRPLGAKHRRRYDLLGGMSLLSPEYLLSVECWPFHSEPPDHYDLLSHLLDMSVSQSSTLMPLHYQYDFRPYLAYLRTPPLLFGRRPPQSNCLPCMVPGPVHEPELEPQTDQGGISRTAPSELAAGLLCLAPILHRPVQSPMQSYSKGSWGLSVSPRVDCIITTISISLSLGRRQCGHRYATRAGRNLPDKEFRYLRTVIVTAAVYRDFNPALARLHLIFRHRAGVTPYTSTYVFAECCVFIKQSQPPFYCNPFSLTALAAQVTRVTLLPKLRVQFAEFLLPSSLKRFRIFILPTCVGLRYGLVRLKLRGFSWNPFRLLRKLKVRSPHTLELRARIFLSAFSNAGTRTSIPRTTFRDPSPHRILTMVQEYSPASHQLRISASP